MNKIRVLLITVFGLFNLSLFAQIKLDSAYLQVSYLEDFVKNVDSKSMGYDELLLNIGPHISEFYSKRENQIQHIRDSIFALGGDLSRATSLTADIPRSYQYYHVYKNYPSMGMLTYIDKVLFDSYRYEESLEKPVWTLLSERKDIQGYSCQKAMTVFKGRKWVAWYTTEIPISDGPWKLNGLPGLILDAVDSDSLFHFYCVGMKQFKKSIPINIKGKVINCSKQELYGKRKQLSENMVAYMKSMPQITNVIMKSPEKTTKKYIEMEVPEPTK
jgi:GLPGLI family protein